MPSVVWLREDLHLEGNPAATAAVAGALADGDGQVVVLVPVELDRWAALPPQERTRRLAVLHHLDDLVDGQLLFQHGDPAVVVPPVARAAAATQAHVLGTGRAEDVAAEAAVRAALDVPLVVHDDGEPGERSPGDADALGRATFSMPVTCHGYPPAPEQRWQRVSSRVVRDGRVVLREHEVVLPDGSTTTYDVDESNPFAVAVLAQVAPGRVLLTRQYRFPLDRWIHDLPGGAGHADETPAEAARRECEEEVGEVPGVLTHLHTYFHNPGRASWPTHLFYAWDLSGGVADTSDAAEDVRRVVVDVDDVDAMVERGDVVDPALFMAWTVAQRRGLVVKA